MNGISVTRAQDFAKWYQEIIKEAELAENSPSRGCMTIRPWGYAIWEHIHDYLDKKIKETGHQNLYFPIFIPKHFFEKEAKHVDGFAKECAVVTHHRLELENDELHPAGELTEPYIVRPTSETIIGEAFSRWIKSYNDLPMLTNQWANVVRWEMRPRLFLRTVEFLWQEGHTAHATEDEAISETLQMLKVYEDLAVNILKIPVLTGLKSPSEKFAGAVNTYAIEAVMQDGKALQMGTSHHLGQNFARSFEIKFTDADGNQKYVHTASWGVSTRLIGGIIMAHSDDNGLVLPSAIAPVQIVIIPILKKDDANVLNFALNLKKELETKFRVKLDDRKNLNGGEKNWEWIKKGVPLRIEVGERDIANNTFPVSLRCKDRKDKVFLKIEDIYNSISKLLTENDDLMFNRALNYRDKFIYTASNKDEFYNFFKESSGMVKCYYNGSDELEASIKNDLGVTIRILQAASTEGKCIFTNAVSKNIAYFARSY